MHFDFYETVVWRKRGFLNEPNEHNALLVINTNAPEPFAFASLTEPDAERRHREMVEMVELEPRAEWARQYVLERRLTMAGPTNDELGAAIDNSKAEIEWRLPLDHPATTATLAETDLVFATPADREQFRESQRRAQQHEQQDRARIDGQARLAILGNRLLRERR